MKLTFNIEVTEEGGVKCSGHYEGQDVFEDALANIAAVGALEIARSSLLARRWGIEHAKGLITEDAPEDDAA